MKDDPLITLLEQLVERSENVTAAPHGSGLARDLADVLSTAFAQEDVPRPGPAQIAAYVEGRLEGADREAFEAALVASPDLRAEIELLCDRLVDADATTAETVPGPVGAASIAGLRASLLQGQALSLEQQRALFRDPALRAEFNRLVPRGDPAARPTISLARVFPAVGAALPASIAASTDKRLVNRSFGTGSIAVTSGGRPHLVRIEIKQSKDAVAARTGLVLQGRDGRLGYIELPPPESDGSITKLLDLRVPADAEAAALIEDPMTTGQFVTV